MKNQKGFTLIELMIVVAIIAILAAIALPAYQDYLVKSRVSEVMLAASSARTTVSEAAAADTANATAMPGTVDIESQSSKYVSGVAYANGRITATGRALGGTTPTGTIILVGNKSANGQVEWTCTGTIAAKYRPATCQGALPTTGG
ncbi:pilin [Stenotrophomonas sp. LGBM10]|uniref:pilin n=1 Tax=Stenotrophomonas sp. LGBM10 TaxID=3390038 RepID=UPI00398B4B0D